MKVNIKGVVAVAFVCLVILGLWWLNTPHTYADCILKYTKPNVSAQNIVYACELKFGSKAISQDEADNESTLPRWLIVSSRPLTPIPSLLVSYAGVLAYFWLVRRRSVTPVAAISCALVAYFLAEILSYIANVHEMHLLAGIGAAAGLVAGFFAGTSFLRRIDNRFLISAGSRDYGDDKDRDLVSAVVSATAAEHRDPVTRPEAIDESSPTQKKPIVETIFLFGAGGILSVKGRMGRKVFLVWVVLLSMAGIFSGFPAAILVPSLHLPAGAGEQLLAISPLPFLWAITATYVKRLHDMNGSGLLVLAAAIPIVGILALTFVCALSAGDKDANRFGPSPSSKIQGLNAYAAMTIAIIGFMTACSFAVSAFANRLMP
ncbi:DUF805 domain-containing protein [Dyella solisilvae]|uniref:DUF805 domain-containing protein n=1 Tax=Dyella solisilvae TaxID=1920168 RepID=A0A370K9G4_9GAMM|nr:DUF805 domain-containing protein [Dyella solisilvae]RDI99296.1 DUF805 domain-containing protein [Dyella solisilvae]